MTHALKRKDKPEKESVRVKILKQANDRKHQKAAKPVLNAKEQHCCDCATD